MQIPLQITFRHMEGSPALENRVRELVTRLEKFSSQILHCHVVIEGPHGHQHQGERFDIRIDMTVPGKQINVQRARPMDATHQDPYIALRDIFRAARRQLEEYERERRQDVKTHIEMAQGQVCEIHPEQGFGRIQTEDGRLIYFHENSVLGHPFAKITTDNKVRFAEEAGEQGPQASTVHVIS